MLIAALSEPLTGNTGLSCNMKVWITRLFALVAGRDLMVSSVPLNPQAQCMFEHVHPSSLGTCLQLCTSKMFIISYEQPKQK